MTDTVHNTTSGSNKEEADSTFVLALSPGACPEIFKDISFWEQEVWSS